MSDDRPVTVAPAPWPQTAVPDTTGASPPPRPVIVHYHIFKNAGTSVDGSLRANFPASWDTLEANGPWLKPERLAQHLVARPWVSVFSSHTTELPVPEIPGLQIVPVLFVRHPIDRIRSIYDFERRQQVDNEGANAAKQYSFAGYVGWRLDRPRDFALEDFQTRVLARAGRGATLLERALDAVVRLPFVGLVEDYPASVDKLQRVLEPHFPRIRLKVVHANATRKDAENLTDRLAVTRQRLGDPLYERLVDANCADLALWESIAQQYGVPAPTEAQAVA